MDANKEQKLKAFLAQIVSSDLQRSAKGSTIKVKSRAIPTITKTMRQNHFGYGIINCYRNLKPDLHSLSNISCSSNNAISFLYFINRSSLILSGAVIAALAAHSILPAHSYNVSAISRLSVVISLS
jgi:hypothetical protein